MTIVSFEDAKQIKTLAIEEERALFNFALDCRDLKNSDLYDPNKLFMLDSVIRSAPVVVESKDGQMLTGLFPTVAFAEKDARFVWLSYYADSQEYCIGDESEMSEFIHMQKSK